MPEMFNTTKLKPLQETGNEAQDILMYVYNALQAKGYDPITQIVGYIISGDPTYITSHNQARSMICRLERDEILHRSHALQHGIFLPQLNRQFAFTAQGQHGFIFLQF